MKFSFSGMALVALTLPSMINGHMVMKTPKPFGNPNNSPLDASGSDFPCKGGPYDRSSVSNIMPIGSTQTLSFTGSAVHGGGSCQISLTTDLQPSKSTRWMVIKSIEGGCPASVAGNLPADPNGSGASTFQYTIPEGIAPGEYVISWSWINKIGNREFYQNCGPATITAAQKKRYAPLGVSLARRQSSFPDMFVANIASVNDCKTPETFDYNYPNPGPVVQSAGTGPYTNLACGASGNNAASQPTASPASGGNSGVSSVVPSASPATATDAAAATATGSGSSTGSGNGGSTGNGQGQGQGQGNNGGFNNGNGGTRTGSPGAFATGAAPLSSDTGATPSAAPATSSSAGSSSAGSPCSDEGAWSCLPGGSSFQRCASGQWSQVMSMAAGMSCTPGVSANIAMNRISTVKYTKRAKWSWSSLFG